MKTKKPDSFDQRNRKKHTEDLGLQVPADYFSKSKATILSQVSSKKRGKLIMLSRKTVVWSATVAALLILAISIFNHNDFSPTGTIPNVASDSDSVVQNEMPTNNDPTTSTDDILLTSLFVEESNVNEYVDNYIKEAVINHVTSSK